MSEPSNIPAAWNDIDGVTAPSMTKEIVGHQDAQNMLVEAYRKNKLHHAWLIAGPAGIGKATMAFRFAEYLLRNPDPDKAPGKMAFDDDPVHSQVSKGVHPNLLVLRRPLDPKTKKFKTKITVDEVRRAGAFLHSAGGANAYRICIVDPADDLNNSAANALLKMLEEPPARTVFLVLAHSPRGLLPTIRSRCQMLSVRSLSNDEMLTVLKRQPLASEMSDKELSGIIHFAEGSPRRALQLAKSGIVDTFSNFLELAGKKQCDLSLVHKIAGQLTPVAKAQDYELFFDLVNDHLARQSRSMATNDQIPLSRLARMAEIWDKTRAAKNRADIWNLDKKQVILDLFADLRAA